MSNPYNNEVIFNGRTLMSLKEDTVTPNKVLAGETFHDRSGAPQTGSLITHNVYDGLDSTSTSDALSANQGRVLNEKYDTLNSKISYKDYLFENLDFAAGTIATRGLQKTVDISSDMSDKGTPISAVIISITDSGKCIFQTFIYSHFLYLNGYRASTNTMTGNSVCVRVTYMKS